MFREASPPNLEAAAEDNAYALIETFGRLPRAELITTPALVRCRVAGIESAMFNSVGRNRFTLADADQVIEETLADYRAAGTKAVMWWVGGQTQPPEIGAKLEQHGFEKAYDSPAMAVDLHHMDETTTRPPNFRITAVTSETDVRVWATTFATSFNQPTAVGDAWHDTTLRRGLDHAPWTLYLGWLDDVPVATGMLFYGAGIAGIYGIGTLPDARGKGIGKAITLRPLLDARAAGCHIGALFASPSGYPIYQRIGFGHYGSLIRYRWEQA